MLSTFLKKYNAMNLQLKVVFWFTVVGFLAKGISVITTPIFTRVLSTDEYGLFSVFSSYNTVFMCIATLNLHLTAVYNAFTKHPEEKDKVVSTFQSLTLCISIGISALAIMYSEFLSNLMDLPRIIVIVMFIGFIFAEPYQLWLVHKRYKFDYKKPVIVSITISILTPIISILCILLGSGNKGIIRIISFVIVNTIIPGSVFFYINYKHSRTFYSKNLWRYAISFAVPLIPHYLSETLLNQTDKIMINSFFGSSEAGIYNIAFTAASFVQILTTAINSAYIPWQFQKIHDKDYKKLAKTSYMVLIGLFIVISLIILFAPEIVHILAGSNYMGAVSLIPTLAASVFFNYMYQLFARIEMYCEKKAYTVFATMTATILNIVLNYIFMPTHGYTFAGYSTLIAHIWFVAIHYICYKKTCKECLNNANIYDWKIIMLISALLLCTAFVVTWTYNFLWIRTLILIILAVLILIFRNKIVTFVKSILRKE